MALDRTWYNTLVNDDSSNTVGTLWDKAAVDSLMDAIDAALATLVVSGTATIGGLLTVNGQIAFPATQNPSAGANTLDDYEEGNWTPTLGGTTTYAVQYGRYTKIGRQVTCVGELAVTLIGTGSTSVISGLPFTVLAGSLPSVAIGHFTAVAVALVRLAGYATGTTLQLTTLTAAAVSMNAGGVAVFGNGADVFFSVTYFV
jgi:hypothetical protein